VPRFDQKSSPTKEFAAHFHLLSCVNFEDCQSAQRRLAYDALTRADGRIVVLLCEHPPLITIGRRGSRGDVELAEAELQSRGLALRYHSRGGGTLWHGPGQLAVYPVVPLDWHRWTVGNYLRRLRAGLASALTELHFRVAAPPGRFSLWGRLGLVAAVGIAVKNGVATQGAHLNVNTDMRVLNQIEWEKQHAANERRAELTSGSLADGSERAASQAPRTISFDAARFRPTFSSLLSEHGRPVKMASVRAAVVKHLAETLGCESYHLHTGHPFLAELPPGSPLRESAA
jgi:lipoyl(octanoyl) transferase